MVDLYLYILQEMLQTLKKLTPDHLNLDPTHSKCTVQQSIPANLFKHLCSFFRSFHGNGFYGTLKNTDLLISTSQEYGQTLGWMVALFSQEYVNSVRIRTVVYLENQEIFSFRENSKRLEFFSVLRRRNYFRVNSVFRSTADNSKV